MHLRFLLPTVRRPRQILQRCLEYAFPIAFSCFDRARLTSRSRNLKPGGWIEIHDIVPEVFSDDGTAGDDHPIHTLYKLVDGPFSSLYGWNFHFPANLADTLRLIGFVNVSVRHNAIPIGRWHREAKLREMGLFAQSLLSDWLVTMLTRHETLGLNAEGAHKLGQDILDAFNNPQIHAQHDWLDVWAQKPLP